MFLHHELGQYQYSKLVRDLHELPASSIYLALALCAINYIVLTLYDALSLRYVKRRIRYLKIALASFVGYAFSYNLGFPLVTGSAVRFRFLSQWGLSAVEITKVIAFNGLAFWLGFWLLGGLFMVVEPLELSTIGFSALFVRTIGIAVTGGGIAVLLWVALRRRPLVVSGVTLELPSLGLAAGQILVAWLDWMLVGTVLYVLLPAEYRLSYPIFMDIFFMAQVVALVSHVPGGLGVFETVLLSLLPQNVPPESVLASLLVYRIIYYLLPFLFALVLFGGHEVVVHRSHVKGLMRHIGDWSEPISARVLAYAVYLGGLLLLISGALPPAASRFQTLQGWEPRLMIESAHFLASTTGAMLLVISWGVRRRLLGAYRTALALLGAGAALSLLKGIDYEEAVLLLIILGVLFLSRRHFFRKSAMLGGRLSWSWLWAIGLGVLTSVWLGFYAHRRAGAAIELWQQLSFSGGGARFLRASAAAIAVVLIFVALKFRLRPALPAQAASRDREAADALLREWPRACRKLLLSRNTKLLFNPARTAFLAFVTGRNCRITLGDPIGAPEAFDELLWDFRERCDDFGETPAFYGVSAAYLGNYTDLGMSLLKIGEEGRVPLTRRGASSLEDRLQRVAPLSGAGSVELWSAAQTAAELPALKAAANGGIDERQLVNRRTAVLRDGVAIIAFGVLCEGAGKEEVCLEAVYLGPGADLDVVRRLYAGAMRAAAAEGFRWFSLGMLPDLGNKELAELWSGVKPALFDNGEHFRDLQALCNFKRSFHPQWEARYLVCPVGAAIGPLLARVGEVLPKGGVSSI